MAADVGDALFFGPWPDTDPLFGMTKMKKGEQEITLDTDQILGGNEVTLFDGAAQTGI